MGPAMTWVSRLWRHTGRQAPSTVAAVPGAWRVQRTGGFCCRPAPAKPALLHGKPRPLRYLLLWTRALLAATLKQLSRSLFRLGCFMDTLLIRIDPARHAFRFYRLSLWSNLFGGVSLVREWGRIGQPGQLRLDPYPDQAAAAAVLEVLRRRKVRRGYREVP